MAYNPKYQLNLNKIFNKAYSGSDKELRARLRETLASPLFRNTFGKMVIDTIIERTQSGIDKDGIKFEAYSKTYINSDVFKIYRKSAGQVDLKLTGEMLASLTVAPTSEFAIELIGDENKAKAHGHKYGIGKKSGRKVKRDFLGLPLDVEVDLLKKALEITRNEAFEALSEYFENTTLAETFGQVGNQNEFAASLLTNDVLAQIANEVLDD